jgi:hypothetical protein
MENDMGGKTQKGEKKHYSRIKHKSTHLHYPQQHYKPVIKMPNKSDKYSHLALNNPLS